ncbi:MAG TPA: class I SAM-dependent methyltransferase [Victivallales bacterium]|nr:class I SAM-dependent methyltransferase [Victivallales bacterium]
MTKTLNNSDYKILDSGNLQKLEQVGPYILIRPALNAFWPRTLSDALWDKADALYQRNSSGSGKWTWFNKLPSTWNIIYGGMKFIVKPTDFGHLGFFPEQKDNWDWLRSTISNNKSIKTLNLFAYSGGSSLAMAEAGANVCHVDAAKGMVDWAKNNLDNNTHIKTGIRWIVDDVTKFMLKEIRRKSYYSGIVLDPPSFGRGPRGQLWKIENDLISLLENCKNVLDKNPQFLLLTMHSHGFSENSLSRILKSVFPNNNKISTGEMTVVEDNGNKITAGLYARLIFK